MSVVAVFLMVLSFFFSSCHSECVHPFLILSCFFYTFCAVWFLWAGEFEPRGPRWVRVLIWVVYGFLNWFVPNMWLNDTITMIVLCAYYMAVGWFFYHRSRNWLLYQVFFYMATYAAQIIGIFLVIRLSQWIAMDSIVMSYGFLIMKVLLIIIITAGLRFLVKKRGVSDRKNLKVKGMMLVPIISFALIFLYMGAGEIFFVRYGYEWIIVYCVLLLIINGWCVYVWHDVAANRELKHRIELMEQQNELTHQYYEEMEKNYNRSRKIIHDIRNHLHALEQSAKMEDSRYFEDVHGMLNSLGLKFYSDNKMLNIILNDKLKKFSPEQVECNLGGISLDFVSDMDMTTIFANLLDNAVEARDGNPGFWVKIRGEQIQDFTVIKIWNPALRTYEPGQSGKTGHEGIGLSNVRQAMGRYHGELKIECKDNIFSVTLVFPGQGREQEEGS